MITFLNSFLSYLLVVIVFFAVIICGVLIGKKLRENKDAKQASLPSEKEDAKEGENL